MNHIELKATRQALGLTVAEAALVSGVTKRAFLYWEQGSRAVPGQVDELFRALASEWVAMRRQILTKSKNAALPSYHDFEEFKKKTGCDLEIKWRLYQSVVGHLFMTGKRHLSANAAPVWRGA